MKFKRIENNLIWEQYGINQPGSDAEYASEEDAELIIAPMGGMEPEVSAEEETLDGALEDDVLEDDIPQNEDNEIIRKSLNKLVKRANIIQKHCESSELETWMIAKIIKAEDYISDVWEELDDVADFANDGLDDI